MKESITYKCYSRRLMYWFGLHGVSYKDKFMTKAENRPYWTFEYNEELRELLAKWDEFKKTI